MRKMVLVSAGGGAAAAFREQPLGEPFTQQVAEGMERARKHAARAARLTAGRIRRTSRAFMAGVASVARAVKPHRRHHQRNAYARAAHQGRRQAIGFGFALMLAAIGSVVSVTTLSADHSTMQQASQVLGAQTHTSNAAAADGKPTAAMINSYAVASDMPRLLDIPEAKVHARVQQTAAALGLPQNKYDTAWDTGSANPTDDIAGQGAALITGSGSGVFSGLASLVSGDTLTVTRGDGATLTYEIMRVQVYDTSEPNATFALTPYENDRPCLNVVATGLNGDSSVLVFAVQQ